RPQYPTMRRSASENTPGQLSKIGLTLSTETPSRCASSLRGTGCPSASRRYKSKDNCCSSKFRLGKHLTMLAANSSRFSFEGVAIVPPYLLAPRRFLRQPCVMRVTLPRQHLPEGFFTSQAQLPAFTSAEIRSAIVEDR